MHVELHNISRLYLLQYVIMKGLPCIPMFNVYMDKKVSL